MNVAGSAAALNQLVADGAIIGVYEDAGLLGGATQADQALEGYLSRLFGEQALSGKRNHVTVVHTLGNLGVRRLALVGLGKLDELTLETVRQATAEGWRRLRAEGATDIAAVPPGGGLLEPVQAAETVVEGAVLANYRCERYRRAGDSQPAPSLAVLAAEPAHADAVRRGVEVGLAKAEATCLARDLVNTSASDLTPEDLANQARQVAAKHGLTCTVLEADELAARGFGLLLAVNRGSPHPAALIVLSHQVGDGPALGLVGKGVCFDAGGLSIKSADGMTTMKGDMSGAAAVLGAMSAIARLQVPLNVTAVIPAVMNLVDGTSLRPGDVVTGFGGKSVEILNTDAEGRLILADALAYATSELSLAPVVDIATLTGACSRALGPVNAGVFGTSPRLVERVRQVGAQSGEKFWELPLDADYAELLSSPIADLRNVAKEPGGGASVAAEFLKAFVGETPWAHLDIAGRGMADADKHYLTQGAVGFGVRTLINLCLSLAKRDLDD